MGCLVVLSVARASTAALLRRLLLAACGVQVGNLMVNVAKIGSAFAQGTGDGSGPSNQ